MELDGETELDLELARLKQALGLEPGERRVGRFRILAQIGKGGMGIVYAAEDPELERRVALKLVRARQPGSRARLQARLQREARALGRLTHENVVRVYDVGNDGAELFIAMELVDGPTLLAWQWQRERSVDELLDVYVEAAAGLAAAHDAGLVHRDFKPENVFVTVGGRVLVGDFGLANLDDSLVTTAETELGSGLTEAGVVLGTLGYMAPEQLRGEDLDARADQFAFCVALWEAIAGERPFFGRTAEAMLAAIAAGQPRSPERIPRRLRAVLCRGLAFEREARFDELRELLGAIAAARGRSVWPIAATLSVVIVAGVVAALMLRSTPEPCAEAERVEAVWAHARPALEQRFARASAQVLSSRADAAVEHLRELGHAVCREPSDPRRRVLDRAIDELGLALDDPDVLELDAWVAVIEAAESLDLDRPAIEPEVAAAIDRGRWLEWSGRIEQAREAADQAVALAHTAAPSGWSASLSEALVLRGRLHARLLEPDAALEDLALAEAHAEGSSYPAVVLRARLEVATVFVRFTRDPTGAARALVRLEPALHDHSRPWSPERAIAHELRSEYALLHRDAAACLGHAFAAGLLHAVVHPDPVATARAYNRIGMALTMLGLDGAEHYYQRGSALLERTVPSGNPARLTAEYNQALIEIESDDPRRRATGQATLERLRRTGDLQHRKLAAGALLYLALERDELATIRELLGELDADAELALIGAARLAELDRDALDRARARNLARADVAALSNLEYELAASLGLAACDLAELGVSRVEQLDAGPEREQSRLDFERLLASLDCR